MRFLLQFLDCQDFLGSGSAIGVMLMVGVFELLVVFLDLLFLLLPAELVFVFW